MSIVDVAYFTSANAVGMFLGFASVHQMFRVLVSSASHVKLSFMHRQSFTSSSCLKWLAERHYTIVQMLEQTDCPSHVNKHLCTSHPW